MFRKQSPSAKVLESVDNAVKSGLVERLKECCSEIVMKYTSDSWVPLKNEEATNQLCWILEAVFIHGLKNTFIKSWFSSRRESSSIPNPSFWDFVMMFSHRDLIEQIRKLNYVNSDVGRSRAWIRVTLNEMSLVSYLENMLRNPSYVRSFYKPSAFLRDSEKCDILKNYLVGLVESCRFELVVDNSLLNQWTSGTLSLVGLWVDEDIAQGIDVVQNLNSKDLQAIPQLDKPKTPEPQFMAALRKQPLLSEDDALRIIMASKPSSSRRSSQDSSHLPVVVGSHASSGSGGYLESRNQQVEQAKKSDSSPLLPQPQKKELEATLPQPQLPSPRRPYNPFEEEEEDAEDALQTQCEPNREEEGVEAEVLDSLDTKELSPASNEIVSSARSKTDEEKELTYMEILTAYTNQQTNMGTNEDSKQVNEEVKTAISDSGAFEETTSSDEAELAAIFSRKREDGFKLISEFHSSHSSDMYPRITQFVGAIANEVGMDKQQYSCKFCKAPIGMSLAPSLLCYFTGNYFCNNCHTGHLNVIPARILLNWDFTQYSVCNLAFDFLEEIKNLPLFDIQEINPKLYSFIDELAELRDLRLKLYYVSVYLQTCKGETIFEEFRKELESRDHIYEKIHLYSLCDLLVVTSRTLIAPLHKVLEFGRSHIVSCKICTAKGFVCEICQNPKVIFPFNLESVYKCRSCGAVYHDKCMNHTKPCPRCQRWKKTFASTDDEGDEFCDDEDKNS